MCRTFLPSLHVCSSRHGYNTTLSAEVVYTIESTLGNVTQMLEQLAMDMFSVSSLRVSEWVCWLSQHGTAWHAF